MPKRVKKWSNPLIGRWRIVEMEQCDREFIDLEGPGYIGFSKGGNGELHFGAVNGELDCRVEEFRGEHRVEFSWLGNDEMDPVSGRGWAVLRGGELYGYLYFHLGDDSSFRAVPSRFTNTVKTDGPRAARRSR